MRSIAVIMAAAAVGMSAGSALASYAFGAGNLVLMRGGDASHPQSSYGTGEVPAYLDEYSVSVVGTTATATFVGSYGVDSNVLTLPGITTNSHEGRLERSGDGNFLNFAGYAQASSPSLTRNTAGTGGAGYYQVGQVSANGAFSNTALDTAVAHPQFIRGAYSSNGNQAWVASKSPSGGLQYISNFGTGSAATTQLQGTTDWRDLKVQDGQLFGGTGSSSVGTHGFYAIGSGAPTTGTPTNTLLGPNTDNSASGFAFATLGGGFSPIAGGGGLANVAYTVGDPSGSLYLGKLYNDGAHGSPLTTSNLVFAGGSRLALNASNFGTESPEGVVAQVDPNNSSWIDLFIQTQGGVYFGIDQSGTANGSVASLTFTKIISSAGDLSTNFYGIAPAPIPAPGMLGLLVGAAPVALRRRR